jgi:hypothetical protein
MPDNTQQNPSSAGLTASQELNPEFEISSTNSRARFPLGFVLSAMGAALAAHGISLQIWALIGVGLLTDIAFSLLLAIVFVGCVYLLWLNRLGSHAQPVYKTLLVCVVLFGSMAVIGICHTVSKLGRQVGAVKDDAVKTPTSAAATDKVPKTTEQDADEHKMDSSKHGSDSHSVNPLEAMFWIAIGSISLFFLFETEHLLPERFLKQRELSLNGVSGVKHLILPLTAPNIAPQIEDGKTVFKDGEANSVALTGELQKDIELLGTLNRCNWQQMLRAIQPHCKTLQSVWIIGSNGTNDNSPLQGRLEPEVQTEGGSVGYAEIARKMISKYLNSDAKVHCCKIKSTANSNGLKFQDYFAVEQLVLAVIAKIKKTFRGASEADIMIDTTGGLKSTSIVGAAITFRRQTRFQYIDTGGSNTPYVYDVIFESPPQTAV